MFSDNEAAFVRMLARDYVQAHDIASQRSQAEDALPRHIPARQSGRVVGSTDYSKFENISSEFDHEEMLAKRPLRDGCSHPDHVNSDNCSSCPSSCSHDHSRERSIYEKPYAEKMSAARLFREEGNELFKAKQFEDAIASYKRAVVYLDYTFGESDEQHIETDEERCKCYLNMAACCLELADFTTTINYCRLAIQIQPDNSKCYYRRGLAYLRRGDLELSQKDLYQAMKLTANEPAENRRSVEIAIRDLNVKWREYRKKTSELARSALG